MGVAGRFYWVESAEERVKSWGRGVGGGMKEDEGRCSKGRYTIEEIFVTLILCCITKLAAKLVKGADMVHNVMLSCGVCVDDGLFMGLCVMLQFVS